MERIRGQGSLEYLLLIAGAVLIAIIVLLLLFTVAPVGGGTLNTNIDEYEKIDLCTGQDATCAFFLNWSAGLTGSVKGFVIENKSSWRTLYVNGLTIQLLCGDHACPDTFTSQGLPQPNTTIMWPVAKNGGGPACNSNGGIVTCSPCDVETLSCYTTTLNFCNGTICSSSIPFGGGFALTLPPGGNLKLGLSLTPPVATKDLSGIQYEFSVAQLKNGSLGSVSVDTKAQGLYWYASFPENSGTEYYCQTPNSQPGSKYSPVYGCTIPPECALTQCQGHTGDAVSAYCAANNLIPQTILCVNPGNSITQPTCQGVQDPVQNPGYFTLNTVGINTPGSAVAMHLNVSAFKNVADYVGTVPRGLYVEVSNFTGCTDNASCQAACSAPGLLAPIQMLQLSTPTDESLICNGLNPVSGSPYPKVLGTESATPYGYFDTAPHCYGIYEFSKANETLFSSVETAAKIGNGDYYLGFRTTSGSMHIGNPYPIPNTPPVTIPIIRALFYPK